MSKIRDDAKLKVQPLYGAEPILDNRFCPLFYLDYLKNLREDYGKSTNSCDFPVLSLLPQGQHFLYIKVL